MSDLHPCLPGVLMRDQGEGEGRGWCLLIGWGKERWSVDPWIEWIWCQGYVPETRSYEVCQGHIYRDHIVEMKDIGDTSLGAAPGHWKVVKNVYMSQCSCNIVFILKCSMLNMQALCLN